MSRKAERYQRIYEQLKPLIEKSPNYISAMATISSALYHKMDGFFWCGFYLVNEEFLSVGPYQGSLACQILQKPKGVCWAAVIENKTLIVDNVHDFPGHIACDSRSNSEIVVPVYDSENKLFAVLDVDSTNFSHFDNVDKEFLIKITQLIKN